jgi:uncharacterized protein YecT (DUF1311 family)
MPRLHKLLVSCACVSAIAHAANCGDLKAQSKMNQCASSEFQAADRELNVLYNGYRARLNESQRRDMKAIQMAWLKFRDLACDFESSSSKEGSVYPFIRESCLTRMTRARISELSVLVYCEEGDLSCPAHK